MKEINKIKLYLNLLTIAYRIIPIFLHKPFKLYYLSEKVAEKLDRLLVIINDPTARFYISHIKKLELLKLINIESIKYQNYLIDKHDELVYYYNRIIGFEDSDKNYNGKECTIPLNHNNYADMVGVPIVDNGNYEIANLEPIRGEFHGELHIEPTVDFTETQDKTETDED